MKLKRYDQYINEDLTDMRPEMEIPEMEEEMPGAQMEEETVDGDSNVPPMNTEADEIVDEDPEEEYEFQGEKMLDELANRLGVKVENNMINYNGKKIEFFSETEAFAIDRKGKYKTANEVISKLEQ